MAGSVNKVILVGNLGKDPEVRTTQAGSKIVNLSVATGESWTDKSSGDRKERTEWHRIVIWNEQLADVAGKYLRKGRKVYIEGQLETRKYTDNSGNERYSTEVVLRPFRGVLTILDKDESAGPPHGAGSAQSRAPAPQRQSNAWGPPSGPQSGSPGAARDDLDDQIPF